MTLTVPHMFSGRAAFWATTYTFDPAFFDEYLFRRLGDPPVNANVLVDARKLGSLWDDWAEQPWRFKRVNRDYLVRPVRWERAFHPKTYFFADKAGGLLLIGSGNLGLRGVVEGKEVFCRFDSSTDTGLAALRAWRGWMDVLVEMLADPLLEHRWKALLRGSPWLIGPTGPSPLLHNLDRSILDQLAAAFVNPVDELHVLAPFYDADLFALRGLLRATEPADLTIYLPRGVSVDGSILAELVRGLSARTTLLEYVDHAFVHAKLIGVVSGDQGLLLSGSPNCSRSALMTSGSAGNCEIAVRSQASADAVRAAFRPPGWKTVELSLADLVGLTFDSKSEVVQVWPVQLHAAARLADDRIEVRFAGDGRQVPAVLRDHDGPSVPLAGSRTEQPVAGDRAVGAVWLADADGQCISNAVPVDHPKQLASWLAARTAAADRPRELRSDDLESGVGQLLERLNRECIFDIDDTPAMANADRAADASEGGEDEASGFWERYRADLLRLDDRVSRYERLLAFDAARPWFADDDLYGLLGSMLHRTPDSMLRLVGSAGAGDGQAGASHPPTPQLQVRVGNVLARWSRALDDRRFYWINPVAPVRNYVALLGAIRECWSLGYVGPERLAGITRSLLRSFVGSEERRGYLLRLDDEGRQRAMAAMPPEAREVAAALVYASLPPMGAWRSEVYEWQAPLRAAIAQGVVAVGPITVDLVPYLPMNIGRSGGMLSRPVDAEEVVEHQLRLAAHIDDAHWCRLQATELGLPKVELARTQGIAADTYPFTIRVDGVMNLVVDPRVVSLVRRTVAYKQTSGVIIEATAVGGGKPDRVSLRLPRWASWTKGKAFFDRSCDLSEPRLASLEEEGRGLEALLLPSEAHDRIAG